MQVCHYFCYIDKVIKQVFRFWILPIAKPTGFFESKSIFVSIGTIHMLSCSPAFSFFKVCFFRTHPQYRNFANQNNCKYQFWFPFSFHYIDIHSNILIIKWTQYLPNLIFKIDDWIALQFWPQRKYKQFVVIFIYIETTIEKIFYGLRITSLFMVFICVTIHQTK